MQSGDEENASFCAQNVPKMKIEDKSKNVYKESKADNQVDSKNGPKYDSNDVILHPQWINSQSSSESIPQKEIIEGHKKGQHKAQIKSKSPNSDSLLITGKSNVSGFSKILQWDPWNKLGRNKNKKDKSKKNENKQKITVNHDTGDGPKSIISNFSETKSDTTTETFVPTNEYSDKPDDLNLEAKPAKIQKVVRFHADVKVMYYANDEILGHTIEPLKKELEQQERNKELRKEFSPETGFGLKQAIKKATSDYMTSWYKKC